MTVTTDTTDAELARVTWGNDMRRRFSPSGVCNEDGSLRQEFFKPKRIIIQLNDPQKKKWGEEERDALLAGIEKHGIGKWREIINDSEHLHRYDETTVRVKASKLMGTQSLARHVGWKGDKAAVEREFNKHKTIGEQTGCWKSGYVVENEDGDVAKALAGWGGGSV